MIARTNNCCYVVLGVPRSGTSMLAGVLESLGVDMGRDLITKHWSNPLGHFEDRSFVDLNDKILMQAGGSWDDPPPEEAILAQAVRFSKVIKQTIKDREPGIWGWKDPRSCLTIPIIAPHLEAARYIICRRDPDAVAASLYRRDRTPIVQGLQLADTYSRRIQSFLRMNPELVTLDILYDGIVDESEQYIDRIVGYLGITVTSEMKRSATERILPAKTLRALSRKQRWKDRVRRAYRFVLEPSRAHALLRNEVRKRSEKTHD